MELLLKVSESLEKGVNAVGRAATWLAVPLMLVIMYDVIQRKLGYGATTSAKLQELQWHFHTGLFMLCFAFAYLKDAHVRIELLRDALTSRVRAWIEIAGIVLVALPFCAIMVYFGYDFWERAWATNESSSAQTGLSDRWIVKSTIPIGFVLLALASVSVLLKCTVYLFGPTVLKGRAGHYVGTHHADADIARGIADRHALN